MLAVAALAGFGPAHAQGWGNSFKPDEPRRDRPDHDIVPLRDVFRSLERRFGGYQLGAELFSRSGGGAEYRIDWMTGDGRRVRVRVDARNGRIMQSRGG